MDVLTGLCHCGDVIRQYEPGGVWVDEFGYPHPEHAEGTIVIPDPPPVDFDLRPVFGDWVHAVTRSENYLHTWRGHLWIWQDREWKHVTKVRIY